MATGVPRGRPTDPGLGNLADAQRQAQRDEILPERAPKLRALALPSLAEMRKTRGDQTGNRGPASCMLSGFVDVLDGGEGIFVWHPTRTDADNGGKGAGGVVKVADVDTGRWVRTLPTAAPVIPTSVPSPDIQTFTANGTWTKPAAVGAYAPTWVRVELIPWGASGQGGANAGGGGGSGVSAWEFPASILGATEAITFGAQPTGGAGGLSGAAGSAGTDAPDATFGTWLVARGGKKGAAGVGGAGGYGNAGTGGAGGNSGAVGSPGTGRAAGGGAGSNTGPGGSGGQDRPTSLAGGAAGGAGAAGGPGSNATAGETCGGGGGGGGGNTGGGTAGGAGGTGGRYGAGGAGGGSSSFGLLGGNGGDGGQCFARVTTFYA